MAAVYNKYLEDAKKYYADARAKSKEAQNKIYDEQEIVANDTYNAKINEAKASYEKLQRENAIQKLINENEVAEDMANMGLSNSGLNRTQQTAVQLSYANNKSSIDRQRQLEVDSYARSLAAEISAIKQKRIATEAEIDSQYDQLAESAAQSAYKTYTSGSGGSGGSNVKYAVTNYSKVPKYILNELDNIKKRYTDYYKIQGPGMPEKMSTAYVENLNKQIGAYLDGLVTSHEMSPELALALMNEYYIEETY